MSNIYVVCDTGAGVYYIKSYTTDGVLLDTWTIEATENIGNAITVDVNDNVYTITGDQHHIKKRNSSGTLTLTKTETHFVYGIVAGKDGYIYTFELKSDSSTYQISKRNASDLEIVSSKSMGSTNNYNGFAIDSDGDFYLVNTSGTDEYERWDFTTGKVSSVEAGHGTFNSLGIVGTKIADIHWLNHALTRLKDLSGAETDVELTDLTSPGAVGNTNTHFLFSGYDAESKVSIGKYDTSLTKVWVTQMPDSGSYGYGSICAYPFLHSPTVTTQAVSAVLETTALGNGNITKTGGVNATRRGFCYKEGVAGDPTTADDVVYDDGDFGVGAYTKAITGLTKGTGYRVRAYAVNSEGTSYGDTVQLTTDEEPTVTTQAVSNIGDVTAIGNGNITDLGGDTPTKRGVCWNTTGTPTITDSKTEETGEFATGAFTELIAPLSPETTYYVRAYAMNAVGYSYGAEVSFTTKLVEYIGYGEGDEGGADSDGWVKFITAAEGEIPTGTRKVICSDYSGFTYRTQASETDDGAEYVAYFVISTDLTNKQGLSYYKLVLDLHLYFKNETSGTVTVEVKRDSEPSWQEVGDVSLTGVEEILIKHLATKIRAKHYLFKLSATNKFKFLGCLYEFIREGKR